MKKEIFKPKSLLKAIKLKKKCLLIIVCLFQISLVFPQQSDTSSTRFTAKDIKYFTEKDLFEYIVIDTSIERFHIYNPVFAKHQAYQYLGNLGTAYQPLVFQSGNELGFDIGMHQFDNYLINFKNIKYYKTPVPYTELYYTLGSKNEQLFKVLHTQNVSKHFNFGFNFQKINSDGFYSRQKTNHTSVAIFNHYNSKNTRYNLLTHFILNNFEIQENGGVQDDNFFETDTLGRRNIIRVRLDSAKNNWKNISANLLQSWDIGFYKESKIDDTTTIKLFYPTHRLSHRFNFQNRYFKYQDNLPASGFYNAVFIDSIITSDLFQYYQFENELSFHSLKLKGYNDSILKYQKYYFDIRISHTLYQLSYLSSDTNYKQKNINDLIGTMQLRRKMTKQSRFTYGLKAQYSLLDYTKYDYCLNAHIGYYFLNKEHSIGLSATQKSFAPSWLQSFYFSNHFYWDNDFKKVQMLTSKLNYSVPKWRFKFTASINLLDNFIYFDTTAHPQQYSQQIQLGILTLSKNITWGKWHLNNQLIYQNVRNNNVIHLPEFWSRHSFYFESKIFKKGLLTQIGFDVYYYTPYFTNAYMPATGQFYLQGENLIASYPVFDLFLTLKVKKARVFLKMQHLNQGLFENGYFSALHYPMQDRSFKGGISWRFFD